MTHRAGDPLDDRRAGLAAGALVGAVVLVLGFGSGFWSEVRDDRGTASAGRDLGTVVQDGGVGVAPAPGSVSGRVLESTRDSAGASAMSTTSGSSVAHTTVASSMDVPAAAPDPTAPGPGTPVAEPPACAPGSVTPFWAHLSAAHLATSPGQQVADALDLDRYLRTHTVLLEAMLAPVVEAVFGGPDAPSAFWAHLGAAHLETSPGQQVADALDLDRYVQTHTVLLEDMVGPVMGTC